MLDGLFVTLVFVGFLALFRSLGGHFVTEKLDAIVVATTFFLFYVAYFTLFTFFGRFTPGMQLCGLSVVNSDGGPPTFHQLFWRSFGYLLSGSTLFLGFLWSLWDEDHLTWQDRISHTYLTAAAAPLDDAGSLTAPHGEQGFAQK